MTGFTVAVSAGHHPDAKGAVWKGDNEFDEAVKWQAKIIEELAYVDEFKSDKYLHLRGRFVKWGRLRSKVEQINDDKYVDLAIEIHFNAGAVTSGMETLYAPGSVKGFEWGVIMNRHLVTAMQVRNRGVKEGWFRMDKPGVIEYDGDVEGDEKPLYFLVKTRPVALILEPDFMCNIESIREKRDEACKAIVRGILKIAMQKHTRWNLHPEERPSGKG